MAQDTSISSLRSQVTALVEKESVLLSQAFELSRSGGDRSGVDALFAQVQAMQVQRNSLKKQIGNVLGTQRLHVASEVWRPGVYDYRSNVGGDSVRVRVTSGPIGLQACLPGRRDAVNIETLKGTFDGPLAVDDDAAHSDRSGDVAASELADPAGAPRPTRSGPRGRPARKKPI